MVFTETLSIYNLITYSIVFIFLLIASISDLKKREVPDWLNYGGIAAGFGLNLLFSVISSNIFFIISSVVGFAAFFILAYVLFYSGQWGGGDSKAIMALGALIGIEFNGRIPFLSFFLINVAIAGAVYGILWSVFLAFKKRGEFIAEFKKIPSRKISLHRIFNLSVLIAAALVFLGPYDGNIKIFFMGGLLALALVFYIWIFASVVEKSCMLKKVSPDKLTEGDWISKEVVKDRKVLFKAKNKKLGNADFRKLGNILSEIDFKVPVKRRILFVFNRIIDVKLSKIKKGDEALKNIKKVSVKIKKGQRINQDVKDDILLYFKLNDLKKVALARKIAFFNIKMELSPDKINKDDILLDDIIQQKYICGPKDLGISRRQIGLLKELRIGKVVVKEGIPLIPGFFIAFFTTVFFGNIISILI